MANDEERKFQVRGIHHLALVCKNMARTVHFYRDILGFPLIKTLEIPSGMQHFFFDIGNNTSLAFFWYPNSPAAISGVTHAPLAGGVSAHASMNHVALDVAPEMLEVYRQRLLEAGVDVTPIVNHDNSRDAVSPEVNETTYVRSIYFCDPDGVRLEMAAWTRELTPEEATIPPAATDSQPLPPAEADTKPLEEVS